MISVHFQGKPFNITVIQAYAPNSNAEDEVECFYEDLWGLIELTLKKKKCAFHHRGLEYKSRKSRDTSSNRQVLPWSTEWSRAKANRVLPTLVIANTLFQQCKKWLYTWTSPDTEIRLTEFLITKFRLKLKKVGKTTRPKSNPLWLYSGSDK